MPWTLYHAHRILNATGRAAGFTPPAVLYAGLLASEPSRNITSGLSGTELTASGYARQAVTFEAPDGGLMVNSVPVVFHAATPDANWVGIAWVGLYDAPTGGNLVGFGRINPMRSYAAGSQVQFGAAEIVVEE